MKKLGKKLHNSENTIEAYKEWMLCGCSYEWPVCSHDTTLMASIYLSNSRSINS